MTTPIVSATTLLGLRRAAMKTVAAHLPEGEGMTEAERAEMLGITCAAIEGGAPGFRSPLPADACYRVEV